MQPSNKNRSDTAKLHQDLVDLLLKRQNIVSPEVEMAFRTVPRHLFLPGVTPEEAYRDQAIPVKVVDGQFLSTSSQPAMMAIMLEQLQLRPGMRVLEIGAGTGYNASLMAHIVGKSGQVITIDIDEDIVEGARTHLAEAGYGHVQVLCADGAQGCAQAAPYDRIILTVSAGDIAPDWLHQLAPGGRLLLPLALRSMQVSVAFEQKQDHLASVSVKACGFVGLRGMLAEPDTMVKLYEEPGQGMLFIRSGTARQVNPQKLYQAIYGPFREQLVGFEATAQQVFCG
ncbi:MAG: methyltransferase domain-containing protein, partial [Ktedonobacteraceae bacterium]|nr:methyltransferase domain-containing protein [Ktedonobacteraceae bacterium]